jgi:hypothetical protein
MAMSNRISGLVRAMGMALQDGRLSRVELRYKLLDELNNHFFNARCSIWREERHDAPLRCLAVASALRLSSEPCDLPLSGEGRYAVSDAVASSSRHASGVTVVNRCPASWSEHEGVGTTLVAPLACNGRAWGALCLEDMGFRPWDAADIAEVARCASMVSVYVGRRDMLDASASKEPAYGATANRAHSLQCSSLTIWLDSLCRDGGQRCPAVARAVGRTAAWPTAQGGLHGCVLVPCPDRRATLPLESSWPDR